MAERKQLNIMMIGQGFMGRAHSNAWTQVRKFFDPPLKPVLHTVAARDKKRVQAFADTWDWRNASANWHASISDEIDLVDVTTPNHTHPEMAIAALKAGKHVACEKPLAHTLEDAREMARTARKAKGKTFVWFNYRRCPAVALAHKLVTSGKLGHIRHVRAQYLQDWADESVPLMWRFRKQYAGSGAHGDLNAHIVDMTRFVTGAEITEVSGAIAETFIKERKTLDSGTGGGISRGAKGGKKTGRVNVDDTVLFLARFDNGAVASFEAARQATGNQNSNGFEINGTKGSVKFNFERMNELQYYDATADRAVQGWTTIICTHAGDHPYLEAWWPDAHLIGYEHGFTNMAYDVLLSLAGKKPTVPLPDFEDAYQTQRVLEAALLSAGEKRTVRLSEVR
ncbi:MAG: Gfo/Idh/MocA family protein [Phycisphaerae bacterium]